MNDQPLRRLLVGLTAIFLAASPVSAIEARSEPHDFLVLSLSWSPSYCLSEEGRDNRQQCGTSRRYGLVVHGLWPQYERGYPQFCAGRNAGRVPESLGRQFFDIMPSMGLIGHQWRKHGTCSGLSQEQYLDKTREAFDAITVPDTLQELRGSTQIGVNEIERMFIDANPGLTAGGIAVTCDGNRLEEIRICLTDDLDFRECRQVDNSGCRARSLSVPGIR